MKRILIFLFLSLSLFACAEKISTEQYILSGQEYLDNKKWNAAIIEFKNAIKQSPKNAQARFYLGKVYLQTFKFEAAIIELEKAKKLGLNNAKSVLLLGKAYSELSKNEKILDEINPKSSFSDSDNADIHALRAIAYSNMKDEKSMLAELNKAKELDSSSEQVRLTWARYEALKDVEEQIKWLDPLLKKTPSVADAWSQMGSIHKSRGELEKAAKAFTRAIALRGHVHSDYAHRAFIRAELKQYDDALDDVEVLSDAGLQWPVIGHIKGLIEFSKGNLEQAQSFLTEVYSQFPGYQPSQFVLGLTFSKRGHHQKAVALLEHYVRQNPSSYDGRLYFASSLSEIGRSDQAINLLKSLLAEKQDDIKVLFLLGSAYLSSSNFDEAIKTFKKTVELNPNLAISRLKLGQALLRQNSSSKQGLAELIKATQLNPNFIQAEVALYTFYHRNKNFKKAKEVVSNIQVKQKDSPLGANLLALILMSENKKDEALKLLKDANVKYPDDLYTSDNLGKIYFQAKDLKSAKKVYTDILSFHPENIQVLNKLALIALIEKDQNQAIVWLKQAVKFNPDEIQPKITLANQYLKMKQAQLAINTLQSASEIDKNNSVYKLIMSQAKNSAGEPSHAIRLLKSLISDNPASSVAHFTMSQSYGLLNEPVKMRDYLNKTIELNSKFVSAEIALARLDLHEKKLDSFKNRVSKLIKSHPENKEVQFLNSKLASGKEGYDQAIKTLSEIIKQSNTSEVVIDLAINQWLSGNKHAAISNLQLWLEENGTDVRVLMLLAQYLTEDNQTDEAKQAYIELERSLPNNIVVLNNLAWMLRHADPINAEKYAVRALELDNENPLIKDTLATLLLINNKASRALSYAAEAARALPDQVDIQINYARVLVANNQRDQAKIRLNKLLKRSKSATERELINNELSKI